MTILFRLIVKLVFPVFLEREADRQNCIVIRGMKVRRGDLISAADCEAQSLPNVESPYDESGSYKVLLLAIVLAILKKR